MERVLTLCQIAAGAITRTDVAVTVACGRLSRRWLLTALRAASRFGDWGLSVSAGLFLILDDGPLWGVRFAVAAGMGVAVQCTLKHASARARPCCVEGGPPRRIEYPDEGSFPSGHTLHAVMSAVVVTVHVPPLAAFYVPVAILVATSRVVLGVHYPSDVVAGAVLGAGVALAVG